MGTTRLSLVVFCAVLLFPAAAFASDISVAPLVIDEEAKPRDILKGEVVIKNVTGGKISVFPDVKDYENVAPGESMKGWVELSRGVVEIEAGEERAIPYLLHVNYDAKPGHYHAVMWFGVGSLRMEAESRPERGKEILVNVKVLDDAIERLQLATFVPDRSVFPTESTQFSFGLQNTGNRLVAPGGNLRIFDRRGREIAVVPVNTDKTSISPDAKQLLAAAWNAEGRFGKYKAVLDLEYGGVGKQITDTTFFWVLPWGKTLSLFTGISVALVVLSVVFHARAQARSRGVVEPVFAEGRRREEETVDDTEEPPKDAFLEKLRLRKEARERAARPAMLQRNERSTQPHRPVHLSVGGEGRPKETPMPTRLAKFERPQEEGNVVRLSRK